MAQRRRRHYVLYTDAFGNQRKREALIYPGNEVQFANHLMTTRGWTNITITKKGNTIGGAKPVARFQIDQDALDSAIQLLGLTKPVKVRLHARVGGTNGNHRFRNGMHDIMIKSYRSAQEASDTLWHELAHALQVERLGEYNFNVQYHAENRSRGYRNNKFEVEARQMSETMSSCLLCKPV